MKSNIVIIDDHPLFREGIKHILNTSDRYKLYFETDSIKSATQFLQSNHDKTPDLLFLIDISLVDGYGFELLSKISKYGGHPSQCVILSMHDDREYAEHAFSLGALGYVVKNDDPKCVLECLASIEQGKPYISDGVKAERNQKNLKGFGTTSVDFSSLSKREVSILQLVAEEKTSKEISELLFLSPRTVENHRAKISSKLGVRGSHGLLALAVKHKTAIDKL